MIFLIAKKLKLTKITCLLMAIVFLFFAGTENPLVTDWHPEPTAGFFLLLFFYFFSFTDFKIGYLLSALIFLGFKESNAVSFIFLLVWLFFLKSEKRREIIALGIFSIVWFFTTTKVFIPFFSHRPYLYTPQIPSSTAEIIKNFFNPPVKRRLILNSLLSFGFIPLASIIGMLPIIGELAIRLIPTVSLFQSYTLAMHYNVYLGIYLALATIYGLINIKKIFRNKKTAEYILALCLFLSSVFTARKITSSPVNLAINPVFWKELLNRNESLQVINSIPKKGTVMSQNNILPHLVVRDEEIYFLKKDYKNYKPQFIIFDLTPNQNINNIWETNPKLLVRLKEKLLQDKSYRRIQTSNEYLYIFYKN